MRLDHAGFSRRARISSPFSLHYSYLFIHQRVVSKAKSRNIIIIIIIITVYPRKN